MNINQKQDCLTLVDDILAIDAAQKIIAEHPKENDLRKIVLGEYNAAEFLAILKRTTALTSRLRMVRSLGAVRATLPNRDGTTASIR